MMKPIKMYKKDKVKINKQTQKCPFKLLLMTRTNTYLMYELSALHWPRQNNFRSFRVLLFLSFHPPTTNTVIIFNFIKYLLCDSPCGKCIISIVPFNLYNSIRQILLASPLYNAETGLERFSDLTKVKITKNSSDICWLFANSSHWSKHIASSSPINRIFGFA
jgi:hypothetical protein